MERLTKKGATYTTNEGEHDIIVKIDKDGGEEPLYDLEDICTKLNRLAELEDKLESGLLLDLPCKVGDRVYFPDEVDNGNSIFFEIREGIVDCFNIEARCKEVLVRYDGGLTYWHNFVDFDKEVFTDKNKAEEKLKELKGHIQ